MRVILGYQRPAYSFISILFQQRVELVLILVVHFVETVVDISNSRRHHDIFPIPRFTHILLSHFLCGQDIGHATVGAHLTNHGIFDSKLWLFFKQRLFVVSFAVV